MPQVVMTLLRDKLDLEPNALIFPFLYNCWSKCRFQKLAERAGVRPIRFHDLRHCFGSYLARKGIHVIEIKELMRHSKLDTTMQYLHLQNDRLQGITECLVSDANWIQ